MKAYPRYVSHKEVSAARIDSVEYGADGSLHVHLKDGFDTVVLRGRRPAMTMAEPGWYLVRYADGYVSFSPAQAFEEGYTLIVDEAEVAGSGSARNGASDWTSAGMDKTGFPVEKGSAEDVTAPS